MEFKVFRRVFELDAISQDGALATVTLGSPDGGGNCEAVSATIDASEFTARKTQRQFRKLATSTLASCRSRWGNAIEIACAILPVLAIVFAALGAREDILKSTSVTVIAAALSIVIWSYLMSAVGFFLKQNRILMFFIALTLILINGFGAPIFVGTAAAIQNVLAGDIDFSDGLNWWAIGASAVAGALLAPAGILAAIGGAISGGGIAWMLDASDFGVAGEANLHFELSFLTSAFLLFGIFASSLAFRRLLARRAFDRFYYVLWASRN